MNCVVCGKPETSMKLVAIATGWRTCCWQLYPPYFPATILMSGKKVLLNGGHDAQS